MKILFSIFVIFSLLLTVSAFEQNVFADTYTIKPVGGSGAPGCEETGGGCYTPSYIAIEEGDSIRFINTDNAAHTITSGNPTSGASGLFDSGLVMASGDFSFKLSQSGNYDYYCMVHPWMEGLIGVIEAAETPTYTPPPSYTPPTSNPSTTSSIDWQNRYLDVLSDFNDVSAKVGQLEKTNQQLVVDGAAYRIESEGLREQVSDMQNTINNLNAQINDLEKTIKDLNAITMEQVKVIYEWVLGK